MAVASQDAICCDYFLCSLRPRFNFQSNGTALHRRLEITVLPPTPVSFFNIRAIPLCWGCMTCSTRTRTESLTPVYLLRRPVYATAPRRRHHLTLQKCIRWVHLRLPPSRGNISSSAPHILGLALIRLQAVSTRNIRRNSI